MTQSQLLLHSLAETNELSLHRASRLSIQFISSSFVLSLKNGNGRRKNSRQIDFLPSLSFLLFFDIFGRENRQKKNESFDGRLQ